MNQKQSWEEEFENLPLDYFADSVFPTSGNPSELEFINWQRETTRRAMQKKEFFKKIICRAIQTREREISEEVEKIDGQDRLYEGREFVDVDVVLSIVGGKKYEDLC